MMEEDLKPSADATETNAVAVLPREDEQAGPLCYNEFAASDVADIFRQPLAVEEDADNGFWDDEMESMLELKQANPILNDSMDGEEDKIEEGRIDPSNSMARELDEFRGVVTSIASRSKGTKKMERSSGSSSSSEDVSILESPPRVMMEEDLKPSADATETNAVAVLPREDEQAGPLCYNEFAASDVADIFRQPLAVEEDADNGFWDDEMESMLELKQANPILNDSMDGEDKIEEGRIDPSNSLAKELDENVSGEPLSWSNRLEEGKDGFKIHMDE